MNFSPYKGKINDVVLKLTELAQKITLPGKNKLNLYEVGYFMVKALQQGNIPTRASSISFKLFLAVFPAIIFFFTLIPYIPVDNFQAQLLGMFEDFLPAGAYESMKDTVTDVAMHKRGGLLSFGFLIALYFSTNGISAIITAFNETSLSIETRSWFKKRLISILLVVILSLLITTAILVTTFSGIALSYLVDIGFLKLNITFYLLIVAKWIIVIAMFYFSISFLYYYAPANKKDWKFLSFGSTIATVLTIVASSGFSLFVNNFGQYNKLYGSIGTLIIILIWMYLNAYILLIGFEINTSIKNAKAKKNLI